MASVVDEINAYSYLYPVELPSKKFVFKWYVIGIGYFSVVFIVNIFKQMVLLICGSNASACACYRTFQQLCVYKSSLCLAFFLGHLLFAVLSFGGFFKNIPKFQESDSFFIYLKGRIQKARTIFICCTTFSWVLSSSFPTNVDSVWY